MKKIAALPDYKKLIHITFDTQLFFSDNTFLWLNKQLSKKYIYPY